MQAMNLIRKGGGLLLGAALMVGCNDRNAQTGPTGTATGPLSADVAAGQTSSVTDVPGYEDNKAQNYQDILKATITKKGQTFIVVMELGASVPNTPPLPSRADMLDWLVALDTDENQSPAGYDFPKNGAGPWEFFIEHRVYRSGFTDPLDHTSSPGILVDRRPLLTGGQAKVIPITFSMDGTQLTWVVDAASLGDPSTFQWAAATAAASAGDDVKNGYNNILLYDQAPNINQGAPQATWPQ